MQLSALYSNKPELFSPIDFNCADKATLLNVVFARVKKPKDKKKDSHNLGKTTLIHLLDFCLLRAVSESSSHFLIKHKDRFSSFVFFLEIALHGGGYITIRRSVHAPNSIAISKHSERNQDLNSPAAAWMHLDMSLEAAREMLDSYLDLLWIKPWDYRKGFSYFLRTQDDYQDIFQIQKFKQGKDRAWKPYLAKIFGLNHEAVHQKYEVDQSLAEQEALLAARRGELGQENLDRNELSTAIEIKRDEIEQISERLDAFDFSAEEKRVSRALVNDVEQKISDVVEEIYNLTSDIAQLDDAISTGFSFDLDRVKEIFEECKVSLPQQLTKSYEDLVAFNHQLTRERNRELRKQKGVLLERLTAAEKIHAQLNTRRQEYLQIVREADSFRKYKVLQKDLGQQRGDLSFLEGQLRQLDELDSVEQRIKQLEQSRDNLISKIATDLKRNSPVKSSVIKLFARYVKQVLNINGEFVISQNSAGNLDFKILTKDGLGKDTSQAQGKSYGHLICALFDLAVLKALENMPFFHFVYHDGLLEALDDRKKIELLSVIRDAISAGKIQYILSSIEHDLPRDEEGKKIEFSDKEIILSLHDDGNNGRLFKMAPF